MRIRKITAENFHSNVGHRAVSSVTFNELCLGHGNLQKLREG